MFPQDRSHDLRRIQVELANEHIEFSEGLTSSNASDVKGPQSEQEAVDFIESLNVLGFL